MATSIPIVTVSRTETGGFLVRCEDCPTFHTIRPFREEADRAAATHQASHTTGRRA